MSGRVDSCDDRIDDDDDDDKTKTTSTINQTQLDRFLVSGFFGTEEEEDRTAGGRCCGIDDSIALQHSPPVQFKQELPCRDDGLVSCGAP